MNAEQKEIIEEVVEITGRMFVNSEASRRMFALLCRLSALGGYASDVMQDYDADKNGMREIIRLVGPVRGVPIVVNIARKFGAESKTYAGELIAENIWQADDDVAARQAKEWARGDREIEERVMRLRDTMRRNGGPMEWMLPEEPQRY